MLKIKTPAKINLFLKVIGRREDGYHYLKTLMAKINLYDYLTIEPNASHDEFIFNCDNQIETDLNFSDNNLITKAINLYRSKSAIKDYFKVKLTKNIPLGAGLGGGSSNAAGTLKLLNKHYKYFSEQELQDMAVALGADVPFFLYPHNIALAGGIGERLTKADLPPEIIDKELILIKSKEKIETKKIFSIFDLTNGLRNNILSKSSFEALGDNDLLKPFLKACSDADSILKAISKLNANISGLSGSGSTFWANFQDNDLALKQLSGLNKSWWLKKISLKNNEFEK